MLLCKCMPVVQVAVPFACIFSVLGPCRGKMCPAPTSLTSCTYAVRKYSRIGSSRTESCYFQLRHFQLFLLGHRCVCASCLLLILRVPLRLGTRASAPFSISLLAPMPSPLACGFDPRLWHTLHQHAPSGAAGSHTTKTTLYCCWCCCCCCCCC